MKLSRGYDCLLAALLVLMVPLVLCAQELSPQDEPPPSTKGDSLSHPLGTRQFEQRMRGLHDRLSGRAGGKTHEVAKGQFVELRREGEDKVFAIPGDFGAMTISFGGPPGPQRNQIPEPDRRVDNTTIWQPDFNRDHYQRLLFGDAPGALSVRNYYLEQSSGRFTITGDVADWVHLPFNETSYGANYCGAFVCAQSWFFVQHTANAWYAAQIAAGRTQAEVNAYLSQFDQWDRYDYDHDGDFHEPDGYIDHFISIHAGVAEEFVDPLRGTGAIWSHQWYAFNTSVGSLGPSLNRRGGTRIGNSDYWIGDYVMVAENVGVGVVAHEFGHDLGLPDLYDTSARTGGISANSTGYWTLMSQGENAGTGTPGGFGDRPVHFGAFEKMFLGWSNERVIPYGDHQAVKLGPAETNTKQTQQLVLRLPDKVREVNVGPAFAGSHFYFAGGGEFDNTMTRAVTLPPGTPSLAARVRYDIHSKTDSAYLTVNGTPVRTSRSSSLPDVEKPGYSITGTTSGAWVALTADLSAFAGQTVTLGVRYVTGTLGSGVGFGIDEIAISGLPVDGAELDPGWTYSGFTRTDGHVTLSYFNAYFAEYRQYLGYDRSLQTGMASFPYFGDPVRFALAEYYSNQPGLLVSYYDTSFKDNNIGDHCLEQRCGGLVLPVDAHPNLLLYAPDGLTLNAVLQGYDAPFGLQPTDAICLTLVIKECIGGLPGNPLFDDTTQYWPAPDPSIGNDGWSGVPVPRTGTSIRVVSTSTHGEFMQVLVNPQ
jgi:immune inhibitor A